MLREVFEAVVRPPFWAASRLLHRPVFHPRGVLLSGTFRADESFRSRTQAAEQEVTARLSKALGTPNGLPDILGLSFRIADADGQPWDFVLATTGTKSFTRYLLAIPRGWSHARFGSLMRYEFEDGTSHQVWAVPESGFPSSASIADLRRAGRIDPLVLRVTTDPLDDSAPALGTLELTVTSEDEVPRWFDPVVHRPSRVKLLPAAVAEAREQAYAGSRAGRELQR